MTHIWSICVVFVVVYFYHFDDFAQFLFILNDLSLNFGKFGNKNQVESNKTIH